MIVNPFLYLLYQFLKLIVLGFQRVFYPFTTVDYRERMRFKGPGIIVSNHPNTLTDPLHVISRAPRLTFFLANASLYENPIANWLLQRLYTIPVYRPGKDSGKRQFDLEDSFSKCFAHLEKGGILYIAPEGGSDVGRRLQPLKTGTARILLGAEDRNDFQLGTRIVPAGLNYERASDCGSRLYLQVGEPLYTKEWKEAYRKDPVEAVQLMTQAMAERIQSLILNTEDDEQDQLLYRLQAILQHDDPVKEDRHFHRSKELLAALQVWKKEQAAAYRQFAEQVESYRAKLRQYHLTDRGLSRQRTSLFDPITILGAPIWLYGRLVNWLAFETPRWLERKMGLYPGYAATVKIISGLFTFPLFYWLQYKLAQMALPQPWPGWLLLSFPVSGILAWLYARYVQPKREAFQFRRFQRKESELAQQLEQERAMIKAQIVTLVSEESESWSST